MNILSVAPITAAQFGTNFFYKSLHRQLTGSETMSSRDRVATSFAAGATSAALANPTELVVIRQQQTGLPLSTACYNLFRTHGHRTISVAIVPTMLREGIYASFWMEVCCHTSIALAMNCRGETLACTLLFRHLSRSTQANTPKTSVQLKLPGFFKPAHLAVDQEFTIPITHAASELQLSQGIRNRTIQSLVCKQHGIRSQCAYG